MKKVSECMTRDVRTISPDKTLRDAACLMAEMDAGALPVGENDRLIGMVTDRDIAVRGVAAGKGPDTCVRDVMTCEIKYCYEDEDIEHVSRNMGEEQIRRLPVMSRDKRLVGIISLGDIACSHQKDRVVGEVLGDISRSGGAHNQTADSPRH
jgi:CBS domain-containing protein